MGQLEELCDHRVLRRQPGLSVGRNFRCAQSKSTVAAEMHFQAQFGQHRGLDRGRRGALVFRWAHRPPGYGWIYGAPSSGRG